MRQQKAEKQRAEKVARETRKAEEAAEETQEATETAAKSAQNSAEPAAEETQKSTEVAAEDAEKNTDTAAFPIDGYDEMKEGEVSERLDGLSADELKRVRKYEKRNKDRGSLRKVMKQKIETTSKHSTNRTENAHLGGKMFDMAGIGKKIKGATDAAKGKGSGETKGKSAGGMESGVDKAKRAVKSRLK